MITNKISRDGANESPWQEEPGSVKSVSNSHSPATVYDCLIVGGGITGLTAALLLQKEGKQTVIADAHTPGFGTTGGTSAHINTFADTTYAEAEAAFGAEGAQLFADAIKEGMGLIKSNIENYKIDCDYESKPGYLYAENDDEAKELADIYEGAVKVGVTVQYARDVPTPVPYRQALVFEGQAQFHPLKYLKALHQAYVEAGGIVLENKLIESIVQENGVHLAGDIRAKSVVYATHMPPNINVFNFECAPYRSYVIAAKLHSGKYPEALIYDCQEPYHYVRSHNVEGQTLLLIGGLDHKTGHEDPEKAFAELEKYARKYYNISSIKYRWSSQYYVPVDGFPYIGQMPFTADGIYCATGYNGNGMMLGSIAGKILSDLVCGKENKYADVFSPSRVKPIDGFTEFAKENADAAYHFVSDRFNFRETDSLNRLQPGTGKLVEVDGRKIAAYRDDEGNIHALNPVCTHAGCIVNWNGTEKSWDCPCHGARYDIDGNVLTGPATHNLKKIKNE
ncbi:FAD-dependent oxidoreductase [Mucilaginibacter sp. L3T2-6]|uniref:FAD-dependent oxidoreductase n=1 Tax=Mucilaginibacter sp. L3T2-6 TaxID=3062491 RepID=UPI00267503C7|nr:FAD-dependent oxidoreductase [Mucilaginibacter sp. L3T2-6]MDO3643222.1 FAD-dependent oxidoreductase [Mucilaginibacter sp. L3T2-6]MDV6215546.1 FAD-dependent oxidoreductase [Mucilaginibacter sp. L3T2-6]